MKNTFLTVLLTAFLSSFLVKPAFGHSNIHSMQSIVGDKILILYYSLEKFQSGVQNDFSLVVYTTHDGRSVEYDKVLVEVKNGSETLEKKVYSRNGDENPAFSYTFSEFGKYTLELEVVNKSDRVMKAAFPVVVDAAVYQSNLESLINHKYSAMFYLSLLILSFLAGKYHQKALSFAKKRVLKSAWK